MHCYNTFTVLRLKMLYGTLKKGNKRPCGVDFNSIKSGTKAFSINVTTCPYHSPLCFSVIVPYLSNHTFRINVDRIYSTVHPIVTGIPHGSVIGPVLYYDHTLI